MSDFLAETNHAGQTLLKLVSRGNALLAELLRLSKHVPEVFYLNNATDKRKYQVLLPDFTYLTAPETYDHKIESNPDLMDLDEEFKEAHIEILERFYLLFEGIWKFAADYTRFLSDLEDGVFIQYDFEGVLVNTDGKQLLCEALYLFGVMLLLMDELIEGPVRERLLVAYLRYKNNAQALANIDEVCKLFRPTGFVLGQPKPAKYPEELFARHRFPRDAIKMIIGRLRSEDIYNQIPAYPLPEHRSTALATQAGMLYVILYFLPDVLYNEAATMREIVDKHFADNWVISYYMGYTVDLSMQWDTYPAAKLAIANTLVLTVVRATKDRHLENLAAMNKELTQLLTEGVLVEEYVLDHINKLLNVLRQANVSLRWLLLQKTTRNRKLLEVVAQNFVPDQVLVLLLNTAQFEFMLKQMFHKLLASKEERWQKFRGQASEHLKELAEYFSGEKPLAKVQRDDHLMNWFADLSTKVSQLDYHDSTFVGRRIQQLRTALLEVEQFHSIETNLQVRQFLADTRELLHQMIRTVYIKEDVLGTVQLVADLSYAQHILEEYVPLMQVRIQRDPFAVIKLRSTFLKLASILDLPLVRINQANSPDLVSVSEFYSSELVEFVRRVLAIIPRTMFDNLNTVIDLQTHHLKQLPTRFERESIKELSQLDLRHRLAQATHAIAVFAEGICSMDATLVGVIEVKPHQLLEEGIRRELVNRLTETLHRYLQFPHKSSNEPTFEVKLAALAEYLHGFARSFEYIQDYVGVYGLKIWQEEFARVIEYSVEQECNRFLKLKIMDYASAFQSDVVPIPRFPPVDEFSANFIGRVSRELMLNTDAKRTVYAPQMGGWFDPVTGKESVGLATFSLLHKSLSVWGLAGVDRFFGFSIAQMLQIFGRSFRRSVLESMRPYLVELEKALEPTTCLPANPRQVYEMASSKLRGFWPGMVDTVSRLGQLQLMRKHIASEMCLSAQLDSSTLASTLHAFDDAVWSDIKAHYRSPESNPYPGGEQNPLLGKLTVLLERAGLHNPLMKIYVTSEPMPTLSLVMCLFVLAHLPRLVYRQEFATMTSRKREEGIDGIPFVAGVATLLHQFHVSSFTKFVAYLGQYVRATVNALQPKERTTELPADIVSVLWFLEALTRLGVCDRQALVAYVPPYLLDFPLHGSTR